MIMTKKKITICNLPYMFFFSLEYVPKKQLGLAIQGLQCDRNISQSTY